jgi:hypothetical protein
LAIHGERVKFSRTIDLTNFKSKVMKKLIVEFGTLFGKELKKFKMKNTLFLFVFLCICVNVFAQRQTTQVGVIENGSATFTANKDSLLTNYNKNLRSRSNIDAKFNNVNIVEYEEGKFLLVFSGPNHKSVFAVFANERKALMAVTTTSCTTSDCSQETYGCLVMHEQGSEIGYCSPCANGGKCTKTTSNRSLLSDEK